MFCPEDQQMEICLLKSNLEEIENDLVIQHSALPALDAENEQRYRESMKALQVVRSLIADIEEQKLHNIRFSAKRMQLKQESEDITKKIQNARGSRDELSLLLQQEEKDIELQIHNYEDTLEEIADRFRKTRGYYHEDEMLVEIENGGTKVAEVEEELEKKQYVVDELKRQLDEVKPEVPDNLLTIIGQAGLDGTVKELTNKHGAISEKINLLLKQKNGNTIQSTSKK